MVVWLPGWIATLGVVVVSFLLSKSLSLSDISFRVCRSVMNSKRRYFMCIHVAALEIITIRLRISSVVLLFCIAVYVGYLYLCTLLCSLFVLAFTF